MLVKESIRTYLARIGQRGGRTSRRTLATEDARRMVQVREARRAYRKFHSSCFWSYNPTLTITASDVQWVAEQLRRHGGLEAWSVASKLCR